MQSQKWKYCILHLALGLAIYSDNDNAKRARQAGIWNTHTHTHSITEDALRCGNAIVFFWLFFVWRVLVGRCGWTGQKSPRVHRDGTAAGPTSASREAENLAGAY